MSNQPVSVVILAAGLGTRMRSSLAKVLHRAGGACLLEHVIEAAEGVTTADRIVAVVGHQAERVKTEVAAHGIQFEVQTEQLGTGHALRVCAGIESLKQGRVIVTYGDAPLLTVDTLQRLLEHHKESGCAATVITTRVDNPHGYGRIVRDALGHVAAIVEQKAASKEQQRIDEINSGMYCFEAALLWEHLAPLQPNPASGEIYLTDIVEALRASGHPTAAYVVDDPTEVLGINTRIELADADRIFRKRKTNELMLAGVTIELPETVVVDKHVRVGQDTVIAPFTQLLGKTVVGAECHIGAGSILKDMQVAGGAEVLPYTVAEASTIETGAQIGPFARLRMGAVLEANSRVGNFVELKKTRLGAGAKANHLAYLGDSEIGAKSNIGAGTITCNYDGTHKHKTTIGEGAFVGSNSTLVAPVEIGQGAYVAAGSTITHAVPQDALAFGRARQTLKEGWAKQRREKQGK